MSADPAPLDHYRAGPDAPVETGVYRVVGADGESVTLLHVAAGGSRVNSGEVVRVASTDLDAFEPASNPDTGLGRLRQAPKTLRQRPLLATGALLMLAFGAYQLAAAGDDDGVVTVGGGVLILWLLLR